MKKKTLEKALCTGAIQGFGPMQWLRKIMDVTCEDFTRHMWLECVVLAYL